MPTIPATVPFVAGTTDPTTPDPGTVVTPVSALPGLSVRLDDGTGTFPYDVTQYVSLPAGIKITRGRGDEFGTVDASELQLQFDNLDGRFTLGSATYGVYINQPIRVALTKGTTTVTRFTGYVQDWPVEWPSPMASYAVTNVTAVDRLARLARQQLRARWVEEVVSDAPLAFYPLTEPAGSTSAGDASNNQQGAARRMGTATRANRATFGQQFADEDDPGITSGVLFAGLGLKAALTTPIRFGPANPAVTISAFYRGDADNGTIVSTGWLKLTADNGYVNARMASSWYDQGNPGWASAAVYVGTDPVLHHVAAVLTYSSGAANVDVYLDGKYLGFANGPSFADETSTLYIGTDGFTGVAAGVAVWNTALPAATIARHASTGLTGGAGEATRERIARLAALAGIPATDVVGGGVTAAMQAQDLTEVSVLDAMQQVATTEGGTLFVDGRGRLVMQSRNHRVLTSANPAALALTSSDVDPDSLTFSADPTYLINQATGSRVGGATQVAQTASSIAKYGPFPADYTDLLLTTDEEVAARIGWVVNQYDDPLPRASSCGVDLLTQTSTVQQAALLVELGDRLTISGLPVQSPVSTADLIVEGWTETVSDSEWSMTFTTVPASTVQGWVLGTSALGTTTRLSY